jgi:excisionase family DNA binding protein
MAQPLTEYLTTKELAELLRIKERKVYDLAASGAIPCSRAMGKLLFPRAAVEAWVAQHSSGTVAPLGAEHPAVILGSSDPLLEWALRESRSGLASFLDGSMDGLERFARGEGVATGLHVFDAASGDWNQAVATARFAGQPVVLAQWAWRDRGLIVARGNPNKLRGVDDLAGLRIVPRQAAAGSQVLLEHLLQKAGIAAGDIHQLPQARSESDAALAVLEGKADAALGLSSLAKQYQLDFVEIIKERFDLLVWRRDWFEPAFQDLLEFCRSKRFLEKAQEMGGYDVSGLGRVHFNG